ncbi:hypothetical protein EDD85DRAFT_817880 [Armillaria nabsnona]|nr:hypothetical protein EDD85DRAFT_817880 [Armillaria nabsnona]
MDDIKLYLKPRPAHLKFGERPWMLLKPGFPYGPFCSAWGIVPPDATELYTVHSPTLAAVLTKLEVEIVPTLCELNKEIPRVRATASTSVFSVVRWEDFDAMILAQELLANCHCETVKLVFGDNSPPSPSRYRKDAKHYPEFWKHMDEAAFSLHRDAELVNLDMDLQRLLWTSIHILLAKYIMPLVELKTEVMKSMQESTWTRLARHVSKNMPNIWPVSDEDTKRKSIARTSTTTSTSDKEEHSTPSRSFPIRSSFSAMPLLANRNVKTE